MTGRGRRQASGRARAIKSKRDFQGASAAVKHLSDQSSRDSAAELRLQSLLREMDKFDDPVDDASADLSVDDSYPGPQRRWSDESTD